MIVPKWGRRDGLVGRAAALAAALVGASAHAAPGETDPPSDVVVNGQRGSVIKDIQPLTTFDNRMIEATGATSMADLLRIIGPMARSADGSPPIMLLNGQRTSGYEEIGSLPPEAIERTELLPEQAALRFGYPPTRKVLNFITKARFRTVEAKVNGGSSTDGGSASGGATIALTRIANGRRLILSGEYRHTDPLRQSRRHILPDPADPYDPIGNIGGLTGGEIDPAVSAAAGHPVLIAAVPADPAQRDQLAAYIAGADQPRVFDLGRYRTLSDANDAFKGSAVLATPVLKGVSGSFTLAAERVVTRALRGLPAVPILVPSTNPRSPFDTDVLLYRYLGETPLRQRGVTTTLNGGALLRGAVLGWNWDLTGTLESKQVSARGERGLDIAAINRAVAQGADPFGTFDAGLIRQHSRAGNRRVEVKGVTSGVAAHIPTGDLNVTATATAEHASAQTRTRGITVADVNLGRSRMEAGLSADVPLASRDYHVLPWLGELSLNLGGTVRHVQDYGDLTDSNYGVTWSPLKGLQLIGTVKQTGTAPDMEKRSQPTVEVANTPFFDLATGKSVFVTIVSGGNPNLRAEQKRVRSLSINLRPFPKRNLMMNATLEDTLTRNGTGQIFASTPFTEAAFPELFVRDAAGRLTTVFLYPVNFYRDRKRSLNLQINDSGPLGKAAAPSAKPGSPPPPRPFGYGGFGSLLILDNELQLRPGSPLLHPLKGDTVNGGGGFKAAVWGWGGINYMGMGGSFDWQWIAPMRVRGGTPQTDLDFSSQFILNMKMFTTLHHWLPHEAWTKKMTLTLEASNLLNDRQRVRDAAGATPYRYQPAFLDPVGRTVKLTLRKLF
jgi:iron complex outermembrane recepter protein